MVSLYLRCKSAADGNCAVQAEFALSLLRQESGDDGTHIECKMSCPCNAFRRKRKGWPNFIARARVLDPRARLLDAQGTLSVVAQIQLFQEKDTNFVPRNDVNVNLIRLLKEANPPLGEGGAKEAGDSATANTADVKLRSVHRSEQIWSWLRLPLLLFYPANQLEISRPWPFCFCRCPSVEGEIFHAHRLILKLAAPALAHLCEDADDEECILIPGVRVSTPHGRRPLLTSEQSSLHGACTH